MTMITEVWEIVSAVITGFFTSLGSSIEAMILIIHDGTAFTPVGILAFMGLGFTIAFFGISFVTKLIRSRGK